MMPLASTVAIAVFSEMYFTPSAGPTKVSGNVPSMVMMERVAPAGIRVTDAGYGLML